MAPFQPLLLEFPLHLVCFVFATALMGLSGSHIHQFKSIDDKLMNQALIPDFVTLQTDSIQNVDIAMLVAGILQFVFSLLAVALSCSQFKGRRGEYSGKGSSAWLLVGLVLLLFSGLWAGVAAAYTAYAVGRHYSFAPSTNFREPFDFNLAFLLRQVDFYLRQQTADGLRPNMPPGATGITPDQLGIWGNVTTLAEANSIVGSQNYIQSIFSYKAAVAIVWIELAVVFFTMVVHFALPFVWKMLGLLRTDEKQAGRNYQEF